MKYTAIILLFVTLAVSSFIRADAPSASKPPPLVEEYRGRALDYLKTKRPDLKASQLQFEEVNYHYKPEAPTRTDRSYTESVSVIFLDPSTRNETPQAGGGKLITTRIVRVHFSNTGSEPIHIDADSNQSEFAD